MPDPLTLPLDQHILNALTTGRRETPSTIHTIINTDDTRDYIGNRLRILVNRGYLHNPGLNERSGMYEITTWGRIAHAHINQYDRGYDELFHRLVTRTADTQPDPDTAPPGHYPDTPHPAPDPNGNTITNWTILTDTETNALNALSNIEGITIPSDFTDHISNTDIDTNTAADILYTLHFYNLADRKDGMDAYTPSDTARDLLRTPTADKISNSLQHGIKFDELIDQHVKTTG